MARPVPGWGRRTSRTPKRRRGRQNVEHRCATGETEMMKERKTWPPMAPAGRNTRPPACLFRGSLLFAVLATLSCSASDVSLKDDSASNSNDFLGYLSADRDMMMAVWGDGQTIWGLSDDVSGPRIFVSRVPRDRVIHLMDEVNSKQFCVKRISHVVPHFSPAIFVLRHQGTCFRTGWDEVVRPGWGAAVVPDDTFRSFVEEWVGTKVGMCRMIGADSIEPDSAAERRMLDRFGVDQVKDLFSDDTSAWR